MHKNYLPLITLLAFVALAVGSIAVFRSSSQTLQPKQLALASPILTPTSTAIPTKILGTTSSESAKPKLELTLTSPQPDASVSSSLLTISGKTATEAAVKVNDKPILTDALGAFKTSLRLTQGPNLIVIEASSSAGRAIWQTVVTYTPKVLLSPVPEVTNEP